MSMAACLCDVFCNSIALFLYKGRMILAPLNIALKGYKMTTVEIVAVFAISTNLGKMLP